MKLQPVDVDESSRTAPTDSVAHRPMFIGDPTKPIFAMLSAPADGRVRSAVVVCPPMGKEQAETTRALRFLCDELAKRRIAAVRFDYRHTGESFGEQTAPDAAVQWVASVAEAVGYVRALGVEEISAIGLRAGALFLAQSTEVLAGLDSVVLWDPVLKGRNLVRSKAVLYNMVSEDDGSVPGPRPEVADDQDDERVHVAGHSMHAEAAAALSAMTINPADVSTTFPARTIVLMREDDMSGRVGQALQQQHVAVETTSAPSYFLEPTHPGLLEFAEADIARIVEWIDEGSRATLTTIGVPEADATVSGLTAVGPDGTAIETRVGAVPGSGELFWDTALVGRHDSATQVMVSHSLGQYVRSGPARLWREAGEAVAGLGGRAIRFDRLGIGESGRPSLDDREIGLYSRRVIDGGLASVRLLNDLPQGSTVVHAGICAGSWVAAHAALGHAKQRDDLNVAATLVNPLMWRLQPQRFDETSADPGLGGLPEKFGEPSFMDKVNIKLDWYGNLAGPRLRRLVPRRVHPTVGRLPFVQLPESVLARFARRGVQTALVFSPRDHANFVTWFGGEEALRGHDRLVTRWVAPIGDHTSYHRFMRRAVITAVLDQLNRDGGGDVPEGSSGPGGTPVKWEAATR